MVVVAPSSTATQPSLCLLLTASRGKRNKDGLRCSDLISSVFSPVKVTCGDWKLDQTDTNEQSLVVSSVVNHPNYNTQTLENDIAVVKVTGSMTCEQGKIWPACLPNAAVTILNRSMSAL